MLKHILLAAFAVLTLATSACTGPMSEAARPTTPMHAGPYDNTENSLGGRYVGGGD